MKNEITKETIAKIIIKECNDLINKGEETDFNDVFHYIVNLKNNIESCIEVLTFSHKENNKYFNRYHLNIGFDNKIMYSYWVDGNGDQRIYNTANYKKIEYTHRSIEEVINDTLKIKEEMQALLPELQNDSFIETTLNKNELEDYSEKCYKTYLGFIPKSVVAFNKENKVLVKEWFYNKNKTTLCL